MNACREITVLSYLSKAIPFLIVAQVGFYKISPYRHRNTEYNGINILGWDRFCHGISPYILWPKIYWKHHGIFFWVVKSMPSIDFHNQFGEQNSVQFVSTTMMWYPRKMEMRMALFNSFQFIFHKSGQIQLLSSSVCFGNNKKRIIHTFYFIFLHLL